jgi:VanZ family protein
MQRVFQIAFFLCLAVIEFLATTTQEISLVSSIWDKANHFTAFFVLYILLSLGYSTLGTWLKIAILLAFGMQIEIVQSFIDGRYFSMLDVFADSIGILLGVIAYRFLILKNMKFFFRK